KSKIFLEKTLAFLAGLILKKYHPKIIGITGSIGKTSTKEAVFSVLSSQFRVRKNEKNYNNEIGLPLTIIGVESPGKSVLGWMYVLLRWIGLIIFPMKYPEVLVLEMGADRSGDIKYLSQLVKPGIGIITDVSGSHLEFFKTLEGVAREKSELVKNLPESGLAILNADNELVLKMKDAVEVRTISFGFSEGSDIQANEPVFNYDDEGNIQGLSFKLNYKGNTLPVRLSNILARHQIYAVLSAICVGVEMGINLVQASQAVENFSSPRGRMNLIFGIRNSLLIDDSYNASPKSAMAALETVKEISAKRKIVVLGDMLELGKETEEGHKKVADKFLEIGGDIFLAVGTRMQFAVKRLIERHFNESQIYCFKNSLEAGKKLEEIVREGDLVLIKGSQGVRMEKVVEEVMANPEKAPELLCRQDKKWKAIPVKDV
ncbi:MAG: UDP-N-acetylmuramoyl-tripeptide--D-alanyl-D-alanine ligase, partial [Patescibacteria group bacterium]